MELQFIPNNSHLANPEAFSQLDPHLARLSQQAYIFTSPLLLQLPIDIPGIYTLSGGRQVGKSTLLKQWMQYLMSQGVDPNAIVFLSCELIIDETSLYRILSEQLQDMPNEGMRYLILDEITYTHNWDRTIKYLADTNAFHNVVVVLSGSDLVMIQEARARFPGRRGQAYVVDLHYYPLSFREFLQLKYPNQFKNDKPQLEVQIELMMHEFEKYLIHGGYLTAINEFENTGKISLRTLATYSDWIRVDVIKRGKKESILRELLQATLRHYSSQISWRNLISALTVDHVQTAIDYIELLQSMDAMFIQLALVEDKLLGAPKKHRKFMFSDPFIYHAISAWLQPKSDPFTQQILPTIQDPILCSLLVESIVTTHFRRFYPTYYIKAESEVDVAYIHKNRFWPIEVKWRNQIRAADCKQILKYKNAQIWAKTTVCGQIENCPIIPLPWALYQIGD